jgi:hypothetical protein
MAQEQPVSLSELMSSSRLYRMRRIVRFIPRSPRCKLCNVPFAGPGRVFRLAGFGQFRKNPNINTAARLQAQAQPAQLILSERVYEAVRERFPAAKPVELELKGKAEPVPAFVIDVTS